MPRFFLTVVLLASGCIFDDGSVVLNPVDAARPDSAQLPDSAPGDGKRPDLSPSDTSVPDLVADTCTPDAPTPDGGPDQGVTVVPIDAETLGAALDEQTVECVDRDGESQGWLMPIVDGPDVTLLDGSITVKSGTISLRRWVGKGPSAVVVWDPNACDYEDPADGSEWKRAGLIIRGASITGGQLIVGSQTTTADMNVFNVADNGLFQTEVGGIDDATIQVQLIRTVVRAKEVVLSLAGLR